MRPLHIVHAIPFFDPATRFGGPVSQLRRVCRGLAERGHRVRVVTTDLDVGPDLPRELWTARDGYEIWYARAGLPGRCAPYYARRARRGLDEALSGADVLHLALSFTHMNVLARRIAARLGVPYVYSPRSCLDPVRLRQRRLGKLAFLALFERRIIRDAAAIHVLTDAERQQVLRLGAAPGQCQLIPNAAEFDQDTVFPDGAIFRKHFDVPAGSPMVLFLGRLHRIKGLDILIDAFAQVSRDHPAARLVIAGPDEGVRADLEARIRRRRLGGAVQVVGRIDGALRLSAFRAADLFVLTSRSEGMPNAVLEACAAGTPALITDGCHLPEVSTFGAGRVVAAAVDPVAAAMADMLADPRRLAAMGERGRRLAAERFSLSGVVDELERLYHRLASGRAEPVAPDAPDVSAVRAA